MEKCNYFRANGGGHNQLMLSLGINHGSWLMPQINVHEPFVKLLRTYDMYIKLKQYMFSQNSES